MGKKKSEDQYSIELPIVIFLLKTVLIHLER